MPCISQQRFPGGKEEVLWETEEHSRAWSIWGEKAWGVSGVLHAGRPVGLIHQAHDEAWYR